MPVRACCYKVATSAAHKVTTMNAQHQAQWSTVGAWTVVLNVVSSTRASLTAGLRRRAAQERSQSSVELCDPTRHIEAEALFVRALCEDSNLEMDWLWLATQVVRDHERRYCI